MLTSPDIQWKAEAMLGAGHDLKETLIRAHTPHPVTAEIRSRRQELCEYIRAHEARVFDVAHPQAGTVRALLGWDDEAMSAFIASPLVCNSSPHTGMNTFPPTFAYVWIMCRAVQLAEQRHGVPAVHLRTKCTHHNFYDTYSKPHAWWRRAPDGSVVKTQIFARRPISDHPVFSQPVPKLDHGSLHPVDRTAVELAELGTNYAHYCMIYEAVVERAMGFHVPHRTVELPIDLLNRFTIAQTGLLRWFDTMTGAGQPLRLERPNASMTVLTRADAAALADTGEAWLRRAVIAPNRMNIAQFYRLGLSLMIGGPKMAGYIPEMNDWIAGFAGESDSWTCEPPSFVPVTSPPVVELLGLTEEALYCEREWGVSIALSPVATALGEQAAELLEPMLAMDYADLFDFSLAG
jgi:hypothetical protein